jgi:hypothetical protein
MISRRFLLQGASLAALEFTHPLSLQAASAAGDPGDVIGLSPSQRILLNGVLRTDPNAYLAFASVVSQNSRGASAQAAFDHELSTIAGTRLSEKGDRLDTALARRIVLDCTLATAPGRPASPVSAALSPAIPRIGLSGVLSYNIGLQIPADVRTALADPALLIEKTPFAEVLTLVPRDVAPTFASDGLQLLKGRGGLQTVFVDAVSAMQQYGLIPGRLQQIAASVSQTANSVKEFVDGFGAITKPQIGPKPDFNQLASQAQAAITDLGAAIGMNPGTLKEINTALRVAGSALSGALAGASAAGPIGAAVGGVVGLLGGLFGGVGEDPTVQMISQLDSRLSELQSTMLAGFQALGAQLGTLSVQIASLQQQMQAAFASISAQLQRMQQELDKNFAQVRQLIINSTKQQLQDTINRFRDTREEYERRYRLSMFGGGSAIDVQSQWRLATLAFMHLVDTPGTGFSQLAFIGDDYAALEAELCEHLKNDPGLNIADNFTGGHIDVPNIAPGPPSPPTRPRDVFSAINQISVRLRHTRYGVQADTAHNGAALINYIHSKCIFALDAFRSSPEWAQMTVDQRALVPADNRVPPALAPQDLLTIAVTAQNITANVSDIATARDVMAECYDRLLPHIAAHSLLVNQSSIPALLYIRRRIAAHLADQAAIVFSNPFMAGVDVLRRVLSTAASENLTYGPRNSPQGFRVTTKQQASSLMEHGRKLVPLQSTATISLPATMPQTGDIGQSFARFFAQLPPVGPTRTHYLAEAGSYEVDFLAAHLPPAVESIDGRTLSEHLSEILSNTVALGVIEGCVSACLETLRGTGATVPVFDPWTPGFIPYATASAAALASGLRGPGTLPPEYDRAQMILRTILTGGGPVDAPTLPPAVPDAGLPYPWQTGDFWGWGVEFCRPNIPTEPSFIEALLRPECTFANSNYAIASATDALAVIKATLVQYIVSDSIFESVKKRASGNIQTLLRMQLAGT